MSALQSCPFMTLNSQPFAIIAFLMFEENASGFVVRRGFIISVYYSIARVRANLRYSFCTKTLLSPSVSSSRHVFSTKIPQVVDEEISCQQYSLGKDLPPSARPHLRHLFYF